MKTFSKTISFLAVVLLLASCDKDSIRTPDTSDGSSVDGGKVEMTFALSASHLGGSLSLGSVTKAGSVNEDQLHDLWILQFAGQSGEDTLKLCKYYPSEKIADNKVSVALYESAEPVRIYFIANVGSDKFASLQTSETLASFESQVLGMADEAAVSGSGYLPMEGVYDGSISFQVQSISLTRMVAKLSFTCTVDITAVDESFTITRLQLTDVATGTRYKAVEVPMSTTGLYPDASMSDNFTDYALESIDSSHGTSVTRTWYLPENLRGVVEGLTSSTKGGDKTPAHSTCIEVSGDYVQGGITHDVTYRIYPGQNSSTDFNLIRNNSYTITSTIKGFNENDLRVVVEKGIPAGEYEDGIWSE